jgi:subtilisin family serine protease
VRSNSSRGGRSVAAVLSVALVVALSLFLAAPAGAFPSKSWWYGELSIAKAQQVSKGAGVTVAVLDSGVQASLPDLRGQVLAGTTFLGGGDARTDPPDPKARYFGHGTAVAGYIAGTGRGAGMVGIAPQAKLLPVRTAYADERADADAQEQGLRWATDHGAKIINISAAGAAPCPAAMQSAVDYAVQHDVIVVAGTGNTPGAQVGYPANCIGSIAVGGLAYSTAFKAWSKSTSGTQLDFVAPAEHMRDLLLTDQLSDPVATGTSIATALVSGTFALLRAKFPTESARQIVTRALWNVHNGLGGKVFAKRINDQLGYGEILPSFALTQAPPANAANPIYDAIAKHLKTASASPTASAGSSASSTAATAAAGSNGSDGGGPSPILIVLLIVAAIAVVTGIAVVVARSRRTRHAGPYRQ